MARGLLHWDDCNLSHSLAAIADPQFRRSIRCNRQRSKHVSAYGEHCMALRE
jgi:hypothetical protein